MTYFQGSKGQQVGFCAGSDPFKEFRISQAAEVRSNSAMPDKVTFMINDI